MARDYMQDILPKDEPPRPRKLSIAGGQSRAGLPGADEVQVPSDTAQEQEAMPETPPERSIRNINVNRPRPMERPVERRENQPLGSNMPKIRKPFSSMWLWALAAILAVVVGVLALFMFRTTTITVTPRSHTIVFDSTKVFTAYPAASATAGTLSYAVQSFDVDDSQQVASQGSTHAEHKASGTVTVFNAYSTTPVHLVKTTRFQSPDGLIFRAPADITIPGMKGTTPGSVAITLVADATGSNYNVAPTDKFTLPGLKGGPMYAGVYAQSSTAFSGGFSGDEASVSPTTQSAAVAEMQGRLKDKILAQLGSQIPSGGTVFPSFAYVTFEDMPSTPAGTGQVNLNERAHVIIPVIPTQDFDRLVASTVSADAANANLTLNPKQGFAAQLVNATSTSLGSSPITFSLSGTAQLVWSVDSGALATALIGKDQSAFQTIVNGFPGIQEARARVEPFWKHTFPTDPKKMQIIVTEPKDAADTTAVATP